MITIIDYGMGNLGSIKNMLKKIGTNSVITSNIDEIKNAEKLILPGVGSYAQAMQNLNAMNVIPTILEKVAQQTPLLGICLGMQLLSSNSEEGNVDGLNIIPGKVVKFQLPSEYKVPHMGWNLIDYNKESALFKGFETLEEVRYYFVHSYHYQLENKVNELATANYGFQFTCGVHKENVYGVQFHPEKSHTFGMALLKNFSEI
jgi:glutamine amidotransferase